MAFAFTQDVPINEEIYAKIIVGLGPNKPEGMLSHIAVKTERGLRYIDVWESREAWQAFVDSKLHPVVFGVFNSVGFRPPEEEPPLHELDVVHVW